MCVYTYVCAYMLICISRYLGIYLNTYTKRHEHTRTHTHTHTWRMQTHECMHMYVHRFMDREMYRHRYIGMNIQIQTCRYRCSYSHITIRRIYMQLSVYSPQNGPPAEIPGRSPRAVASTAVALAVSSERYGLHAEAWLGMGRDFRVFEALGFGVWALGLWALGFGGLGFGVLGLWALGLGVRWVGLGRLSPSILFPSSTGLQPLSPNLEAEPLSLGLRVCGSQAFWTLMPLKTMKTKTENMIRRCFQDLNHCLETALKSEPPCRSKNDPADGRYLKI